MRLVLGLEFKVKFTLIEDETKANLRAWKTRPVLLTALFPNFFRSRLCFVEFRFLPKRFFIVTSFPLTSDGR